MFIKISVNKPKEFTQIKPTYGKMQSSLQVKEVTKVLVIYKIHEPFRLFFFLHKVLSHTERTFLSHLSVDLMWDKFLWENVMLTNGGKRNSVLVAHIHKYKREIGTGCSLERNLFVISVSHLAQLGGTSPVRLRLFLILPLSQCDWITLLGKMQTHLWFLEWVKYWPCQFISPLQPQASLHLVLWSLGVPVTTESWMTSSGLSLTGDSAQKRSFSSNLPLK